jgi:hypothetical protein
MTPLKLLVQDEEDLGVVSACLQDAVIRAGDIAYIAKQRRFAAVLSRFCWEGCPDGEKGTRVRSGLHFDSVLSVKTTHVTRENPDAVAELLAIQFHGEGETGGTIELVLAGGGRIRLEVECIDAQLCDLTEPRPAIARPAHNLERS